MNDLEYNSEYIRLKEIIECRLPAYLSGDKTYGGKLYEAMKYSLMAGGKRLRPVLLLATCKACGGNESNGIPYACAIEYIHTYSLIHDDLPAMDDDDYRRGKLTNHKVYGEDIAILAGDGLLNTAFEILFQEQIRMVNESELSKIDSSVRAGHEIAIGAGIEGMILGQTADILAEKTSENLHIGPAEKSELLGFIHEYKTGKLIRAAVRSGAILGGLRGVELDRITEFASSVGMAFQIVDDILDVEGNPEILGKTVGGDQLRDKLTFPSVYGLEQSKKIVDEITSSGISKLEFLSERGEFLRKLAIDLKNRIA